MFLKKNPQNLISAKDFLKFVQRIGSPSLSDTELEMYLDIWFDTCIKPKLSELQNQSEILYSLHVPTTEEFIDKMLKGEYELKSAEEEALQGYEYFFLVWGGVLSPELLVYFITETVSKYGYKIRWECQQRTLIFYISLP